MSSNTLYFSSGAFAGPSFFFFVSFCFFCSYHGTIKQPRGAKPCAASKQKETQAERNRGEWRRCGKSWRVYPAGFGTAISVVSSTAATQPREWCLWQPLRKRKHAQLSTSGSLELLKKSSDLLVLIRAKVDKA